MVDLAGLSWHFMENAGGQCPPLQGPRHLAKLQFATDKQRKRQHHIQQNQYGYFVQPIQSIRCYAQKFF